MEIQRYTLTPDLSKLRENDHPTKGPSSNHSRDHRVWVIIVVNFSKLHIRTLCIRTTCLSIKLKGTVLHSAVSITQDQIDFSGNYSAMLQLILEAYTFTYIHTPLSSVCREVRTAISQKTEQCGVAEIQNASTRILCRPTNRTTNRSCKSHRKTGCGYHCVAGIAAGSDWGNYRATV